MKKYLKLLRIKNYVKNLLILFPFVFSGRFMIFNAYYKFVAIGFLAFCLMSSAVYIINDIMDVDKDRCHPKKCKRPIASGAVKISTAVILAISLALTSVISVMFLHNYQAVGFLIAYLILNIIYSAYLKKLPIIDIAVLSLFFILRVYYGAIIIDVPVSVYLYLTTISVAFMMGANKRYKEKSQSEDCRATLKLYSQEFLSKISQIFICVSIVFYSLWVISDTNILVNPVILQISIFFVIIILLYYQYLIDTADDGNPVDILFDNPMLIVLAIAYIVLMFVGFIIN